MAFYPTLITDDISLEQMYTLGNVYSSMVETLDALQFSIEHADWSEAGKAYKSFVAENSTLTTLTGESLLDPGVSLESFSFASESTFVEAAKTFIDKIPALIVKIALAIVAIITAAILYFKKKKATKGALVADKPLTVKSYLDSTEEAYLARYHKTEQMVAKLISILDTHVRADLEGITSRVKEAHDRLDNFAKLAKNPLTNLITHVQNKAAGEKIIKLRKTYQRNLESSLGSLHGLYPTHLHENIGVLIINPSSRSVDSSVMSLISDAHRVEEVIRHLRNATIDTLLSKFLLNVSINSDRASSIALQPNRVKELNTLIERNNHAASELIDQFESRVGVIKELVESVRVLGERLESMSVGPKHKPYLKEILDEVNLTSKDITTLIRELQSIVLHLVIKY